jgi:hypothetical protein
MHTFSGGLTLVTVGDQILTITNKISGITASATSFFSSVQLEFKLVGAFWLHLAGQLRLCVVLG